MTKFEQVKKQTTEEYFNNNQFSIDAFNKKYALNDKETYVIALKRVCDFIASVEKTDELKTYWSERWFDEIYNDWWHPAGSIMQGAGSGRKISLANCTTISAGKLDDDVEWDSLEAIFKNFGYTVAKTAAYRQGLGIDFSRLRPRGTKILNSANQSDGSIHWMKYIDSIGYRVGQKGRIPAMLFSLSINHPDVIEFIQVKKDFTQIQNANISVQITDDFYKCVENDGMWEMSFIIPEEKKDHKVYVDIHSTTRDTLYDDKGPYYISKFNNPKEVIKRQEKARTILTMIAHHMANFAEPGIQNIDLARKYSNSDAVYDPLDEYDSRILSTNACSEQYLSRESLCVLASLNSGKFSIDKDERNLQLSIVCESTQRFLDNVNECELVYHTYATPHQKLAIEKLRRTGTGVTDLGGYLFKLNLEYGSKEGNDAVDDFLKMYNYYLYKANIALGKEKGNFGLFDVKKIKKSAFIQHMMKEFPDLTFEFLRCITSSSIAPTGTLSLMFRSMLLSYGVEPGFGICYWKRTRISGKYEYYFVVPNIVRETYKKAGYEIPMDSDTIKDTWDGKYGNPILEFIEKHKNEVGIKFKNAPEIKPLDKLDLMVKAQKWVDSSISVTYMLPEKSNVKDVEDFILEAHRRGLKSIAAFPDKKMYGIVSYLPFKDLAFKLKSENVEMHAQNFTESELKELNISDESIQLSSAPHRDKTLEADIYSITANGQKFVVAVGLLNGAPYEMFAGHMNGLNFKFKEKKGTIEKVKRGVYKLIIGDDIEIEDFAQQFTAVEKAIFRMVSTSLRHGVPIKFIVEQLQKSTDDLTSLTSAAARVLKKYIVEGEKVTGITCPSCGHSNTLIYDDGGCPKCSNCGWSKCS
jgi:ribonucleoside-diphosphate reductase alpha chain